MTEKCPPWTECIAPRMLAKYYLEEEKNVFFYSQQVFTYEHCLQLICPKIWNSKG